MGSKTKKRQLKPELHLENAQQSSLMTASQISLRRPSPLHTSKNQRPPIHTGKEKNMSQSTSHPSPVSDRELLYHYKPDPSCKVDQSTSSDAVDTSTFGPTAPAPRTGNAHVFFHLGHTGHEIAPKLFPACVSPGKGAIVREGHLHGAWTCLGRPYHSDVDRFFDDDDSNRPPRSVTFPANPGSDTPEHEIWIVGSQVIEFSVLEAAEPAHFVRLKVKALIAAANQEFCPTGSTEAVPIWIGVHESSENIFRAVDGQHGTWEVRCDGGAVVRF